MADDWNAAFQQYVDLNGDGVPDQVMRGRSVTYPEQYRSDKSRARAAAYGTPEPPLEPTPAWMATIPVMGPAGRLLGPAFGALGPRSLAGYVGGQTVASPSPAGEPAPAGSPQAPGTILGALLESPYLQPIGVGAGLAAGTYGAIKAGNATGGAIRRSREAAAQRAAAAAADRQKAAISEFNEFKKRYTARRVAKALQTAVKNPTRSDNAIAYDPDALGLAWSRGWQKYEDPSAVTARQRFGTQTAVAPEAMGAALNPRVVAQTRVMADEFDNMTSAQRIAANNRPPAATNDVYGAIDEYLSMPGAGQRFLRDPVSAARALSARTNQPISAIVEALRAYDLRHGNRSNWSQYQGRPGRGRINPHTGEVDQAATDLAEQFRRIQDEQFAARGYFDPPEGASWENVGRAAAKPPPGAIRF